MDGKAVLSVPCSKASLRYSFVIGYHKQFVLLFGNVYIVTKRTTQWIVLDDCNPEINDTLRLISRLAHLFL